MEEERLILWKVLSYLPVHLVRDPFSSRTYQNVLTSQCSLLKKFIQEHKPATLKRNNKRNRNNGYSNNLPPPDESAESSSESPPHSHSIVDNNAQETSSQSNGPHTPSPKYGQLEPYVVKEDTSEKPIITADPHLARLMESLSMSALQGGSESKPPLASIITENQSPPPSAATPVPVTASSVDSRPATGWTVDASRGTPDPEITPSLPPTQPQATSDSSDSIQTARLPPGPLASAVSLSPRHQRSVSALSYPIRPAELTPSVKRMKHLALLESVMDESVRLTPTLEQQRGNMQGPMFDPGAPMVHRSATASVPPQNTMFSGLVPGSVLYSSSDKVSGFPPRVQSIPPLVNGVPPPLGPTLGLDPFTVRPRPMDAPLMNGTPPHVNNGLLHSSAVPPPPQLQFVPHYNHQIPGPLTSPVPPFPRHTGNQPFPGQYGGRMPVAHHTLAARPQSAVPYPTTCSSLTAPGIGPQLFSPGLPPQSSQPRGNAQLLSILNNKGPGAAGVQTNMTPPVGHFTSFQSR